MEDATTVIERKIAARQEHIAKLEQEIALDRAAIGVLTELLRDIRGDIGQPDLGVSVIASISATDTGRVLQEGSLNDTARLVLKEAGDFLSGNDLFEKVKERRPDVKRPSLLSGIYGLNRKSRIFVLQNHKIGLLEWENKSVDVTTN